jgi:phosphoribosylglycinamide formyltransferase-1
LSSAPARQPVLILISGRGSNMRALIEHSQAADAPYRIVQVWADRADAGGLSVARDFGVPTRVFSADKGADRESYDRVLAAAIDACAPSVIVLAGFMRILSAAFVAEFSGRILNIHPSLLPRFPGLHTHRRALQAGEHQHGATVHFVTEELDGGPRIIQARVPVLPWDDEAALAARVLSVEHRIYPLAVRWYCEGRLCCRDGQAWLDGRILREPVELSGGAS